MTTILLNLLSLVLWPNMIYPTKTYYVHLRRMCILLYIYSGYIFKSVPFKNIVNLYILAKGIGSAIGKGQKIIHF